MLLSCHGCKIIIVKQKRITTEISLNQRYTYVLLLVGSCG